MLHITNTGTASLTITNLSLAGNNPSEFRFTASALPISVNPDSSTSIKLQFAPTGTGSRSASLTITDNAVDGPQSVSLSGNCEGPAILVGEPITGTTSSVKVTGQPLFTKQVSVAMLWQVGVDSQTGY